MNNKIYHHFERMVFIVLGSRAMRIRVVTRVTITRDQQCIAVVYHHIHRLSTIILLFMQQIPTDLAGDNNTGNILPVTGSGTGIQDLFILLILSSS